MIILKKITMFNITNYYYRLIIDAQQIKSRVTARLSNEVVKYSSRHACKVTVYREQMGNPT